LDLDEYSLSEAQRSLKRLGITHIWNDFPAEGPAGSITEVEQIAASPAPPEPAPRPSRQKPVDAPRARLHQSAAEPLSSPGPAAGKRMAAPLSPLLRSLFHGKQSPVRTLWTYAGMHADMQEARLSPRLDMFRKIQASVVAHLGWSEADIGSWPLDVPPELFLAGLRFFRPAVIIGFGPSLQLPQYDAGSEGDALLNMCGMHTLPSLEDMAAGDKELKNLAWKALQQIPSR